MIYIHITNEYEYDHFVVVTKQRGFTEVESSRGYYDSDYPFFTFEEDWYCTKEPGEQTISFKNFCLLTNTVPVFSFEIDNGDRCVVRPGVDVVLEERIHSITLTAEEVDKLIAIWKR